MKKVVIIAEHRKGTLKKASLELVSAAKGCDVYGIVMGSQAKPAAEELAKAGVKTYWLKDSSFDAYHPDAYAAACEKLINDVQPQYVLGSASSTGKDLVPQLAARFDAALVADCLSVQLADSVKIRRPFYSGKALADVQIDPSEKLAFITLRPNAMSAGSLGAAGSVTEMSFTFDFANSPIQYVGATQGSGDRPDLTEANIIVSGGRSLKSKENFKILFDLADTIGAAVGASRAAVDEGLAGHDMQVGQTGKTVNPSLYMAFGISGAIQHLAGMRTSKVIVAINKDPQAPIFQKADYGIVGDLFTLAPLIQQESKKILGK